MGKPGRTVFFSVLSQAFFSVDTAKTTRVMNSLHSVSKCICVVKLNFFNAQLHISLISEDLVNAKKQGQNPANLEPKSSSRELDPLPAGYTLIPQPAAASPIPFPRENMRCL